MTQLKTGSLNVQDKRNHRCPLQKSGRFEKQDRMNENQRPSFLILDLLLLKNA